MKFEAAIIGCGPGGMEAGHVLAKAGKKIAVIEAAHWGGTCLNKGCIPTKMLLAATEPKNALGLLKRQKIADGGVEVDYSGLQKRIWRHVAASNRSIAQKLESLGATLYLGSAKFANAHELQIIEDNGDNKSIEAETIIIASGSAPASFPAMRPDHETLLDSTDLLHLAVPPKSLCIIGAGAIGVEFASFFSAIGSQIQLVEAAPQLVPTEDPDLADALKSAMLKRGYKLHIGQKAKSLEAYGGMAKLVLESGEIIEAEKALIAVGRIGSGQEIQAEAAGCKVDRRGFVAVDEYLMAAPNIYAVGDCNGKVLLAHAATHQASYVARRILGWVDDVYKPGPIPSCIFGFMEVMRAGMSAREALSKGGSVEFSVSQLASNPISQAHADPAGFVKAVWLDGALAGMSAVGGGATHLVTAAELLVAGNYIPDKLDEIMMAHPSLDESLGGAIRQKRLPLVN